MIQKRSRVRRGLTMMAMAGPSTVHLLRGLWRTESGKRWLVPLVIFLCLTGLVLIVGSSVEAMAPFIYAIF